MDSSTDPQAHGVASHEDALPIAASDPFEFALIALDLVDTEAFEMDQDVSMDDAQLLGGFRLDFQIGSDMFFVLAHDENLQRFVVSVGMIEPVQDIERLNVALSMNSLMPANRRFAINPMTQCLELSQFWPTQELALADFAFGIRQLIDGMLSMTAPLVGSTTPNVDPSSYAVKV